MGELLWREEQEIGHVQKIKSCKNNKNISSVDTKST